MEFKKIEWHEQAMNDLLEIDCIIDDLREARNIIDKGLTYDDYDLYQKGVNLWLGKETPK